MPIRHVFVQILVIQYVGVRGSPERDIPSLGAMGWGPVASKILGTSSSPQDREGRRNAARKKKRGEQEKRKHKIMERNKRG